MRFDPISNIMYFIDIPKLKFMQEYNGKITIRFILYDERDGENEVDLEFRFVEAPSLFTEAIINKTKVEKVTYFISDFEGYV